MPPISMPGGRFQSTLPQGERRKLPFSSGAFLSYFNPRSRKGSDANVICFCVCSIISIHAPARGATVYAIIDTAGNVQFQSTLPQGERLGAIQQYSNIITFQSTLPQGERRSRPSVTAITANFNPRSRKGSDSSGSAADCHIRISIHAPARGATRLHPHQRPIFQISIHAPARGATCIAFGKSVYVEFQSTLPQGERLELISSQPFFANFNPRSRKGSDCERPHEAPKPDISIHAPARGATISWRKIKNQRRYFNPRSRKGSDPAGAAFAIAKTYISIHAPARGATIFLASLLSGNGISIHAPARGATTIDFTNASGYMISIHAPARGATL